MSQSHIVIAGEMRVIECGPGKTFWNPYMFVSSVQELEEKGIFDREGYLYSYDGFLLGKYGDEYLISVHRTDNLHNWEQRSFGEECLDPILRQAVKESVIVHLGIKDEKWRAYVEMVCQFSPSLSGLAFMM
ncbi:hypothetical protein COT97_05725 [Candidatus Falkowbacteria bacterium CG10_big_fil_rev_8_21_14_0_10_39_11]|uniref:Uncharacterized protein n=1 Tax=Candidatus Falkowbacteria bacterium CG10_big_fil_rev_8_21_14_0_10_39_11 TaxID=1974565 RepID=A0A2H0V3I8_9BACT|nr:MAG: hypothetical protein COT97_05725 [Candidatus Falkowbacteria bacterium CG10_big_fil_rev_8_21_14_0_10_39_11]